MTSISPIIKVGSSDISPYVEHGPTKANGGDRVIKSDSIMGGNKSVFYEVGRKPIGWDLDLLFLPDLADQIGTCDAVTALIDNLAGDPINDLLYPGRSDRFAIIEKASVHSPFTKRLDNSAAIYKKATLWSKATELYSATPSPWSPTDEILPITQDTGETNGGNIEAGLYSLALTARMSGPALVLDGTDDYVDFGAVDLSGDELTVVYSVMPLAEGDYGGFSNGTTIGSAGHVFFYLDTVSAYPVTYPTVIYLNGTTQYVSATAGISSWQNVLLRVGFTYDKTNNQLKFFVNGEQLGDTIEPATPLTSLGSTSLRLGKMDTLYINASFADLKVFSRILSPDEMEDDYLGEAVSATSLEIEADFTEGSGATVYDLSGNDNDGTLTNFADTTAGYGDTHDDGWLTSIGPTSPNLELLSGATVMAEMALAPSLMTAEVLSLDRFGQISQTYSDTFAANVGRPAFGEGYFWADGYAYAKYVDSEIVLTSLISGRVGEEISITITDTDQASTTVSVSGYDITVDLETSGGTPVATAQEVIDVIRRGAAALVTATLAAGEDGTTVLDTQAKTQLALNVDVTGGALVIEDDREAEYHLVGSWPISHEGLRVTFTPTESGTGTATFDVSIDNGASWETVKNNSQWVDGAANEVYVPQAEGETTIWIRWACDSSITSLSIDDLTIYQERYVSDSDVPKIPPDSTYKVQIDGSGWGDAATVWRNRYKP